MNQMSQVHGSNILSGRSFLKQCLNSFLMQTGFEEVLQFRKSLIHIGFILDLQPSTLFERFLAEATESLKVHQVDIKGSNEPASLLKHKCFSNDAGVNLFRLGFPDVILPESRALDRVNDTDFMAVINEVTSKVVAVVGR